MKNIFSFLRKKSETHRVDQKIIVDGSEIGLVKGEKYEFIGSSHDVVGTFDGYKSWLVKWHPVHSDGDVYQGSFRPAFFSDEKDIVIVTRYILAGLAFEPEKLEKSGSATKTEALSILALLIDKEVLSPSEAIAALVKASNTLKSGGSHE